MRLNRHINLNITESSQKIETDYFAELELPYNLTDIQIKAL